MATYSNIEIRVAVTTCKWMQIEKRVLTFAAVTRDALTHTLQFHIGDLGPWFGGIRAGNICHIQRQIALFFFLFQPYVITHT